MNNVNLKRKVTLKRKGDATDQAREEKKPNKFIWLGVIALVIIGGIYGLKQFNQEKTLEGVSEEVAVIEFDTINSGFKENESDTPNIVETNPTGDNAFSDQTKVSNTSTETNTTSSIESAVSIKSSATGENSAAKEDASNNAIRSKGSQSSEVDVSSSVEDKAKQVIRGNFGNGSDRKQALGAEYVDIQAKVNEMYRSGLIE